jgi:hypothetical protein
MMFEALLLIGTIAATGLTISTVIVVQRDKRAARGMARRADQILGALYDSGGSGRPWRSIYVEPARPRKSRATADGYRPRLTPAGPALPPVGSALPAVGPQQPAPVSAGALTTGEQPSQAT